MLTYLLKSGVCLAVFYLFFKLLLEKEPIHIFKRVYLLGGLLLAFAIPLITFTTVVEIDPVDFIPYSFSEIPFEQQTTQEISTINYWPIILWTVYGFGVVVFGLKFLLNLYQIGSKIRRNTKQKVNQFTHVLMQNLSTPHTFFSYIFLNKQRYLQHQIPQEVFWHEETHAKQKHSFDVVFLELLQVVFWFNPLLYFIKKDIKLNHEFLADRAVLNKGVPLTVYQEILLAFSANPAEPLPNNVGIANALNYSSIKKRFTIMKTKTSQKAVWIKSLILLPLVAVLIYGFSQIKEKTIVKQDTIPKLENSIGQNVINQDISDGATERMMEEYNDFIDTFEESKIIYGGLYKRAIAIYALMTDEQKASVKKYPTDVFNHKMSETKPRTPTETEFNSWKDKSKFAIWIDDKNVDNSVLNNYKKSDIVHFMGSFVHKNARSKRFPQTQQYSLYTKKGFEEAFKKNEYNQYMKLLDKYNKEVEFFNKTDKTDNSELLILKQQADFLFYNFTEEELKKYNPPKTQEAPKAIINTNKTKQKNDVPDIYIDINKDKEILINGENYASIKTLKKEIEQIIKDYTPNQISKLTTFIEADGSLKMGIIFATKRELRKAGVRGRILNYNNDSAENGKPRANNASKINPKNYYPKRKFWVKDKTGKKVAKTFSELSEFYKRKWLLFPPNMHSKKQISKEEYEKIKDASTYVVRRNGVVIDNNKLNNYNRTNFVTYSYNEISKLAGLPQKYHYNLITEDGFKTSLVMKKITDKLNKEYQDKATPQEIAEYNKLAREYNAIPTDKMIVKQKDLNKINYIYKKMTEKQKKDAEPYPDFKFPPLPPPPPAKNIQKEIMEDPISVNKGEIKEVLKQTALQTYINKNSTYEKLRNEEPHYKDKSSADKKELDDLFSELGSLFFKLSKENKRKTKRPIYPLSPFIKLIKDGKEYYKKRSELTEEDKALLPPPPPPPAKN